MNRRTLLVRTVTGALSATVFTATGWLMGTRTLTMECKCQPGSVCNFYCDSGPAYCHSTGCTSMYSPCKQSIDHFWGCNGDGCYCYCKVTTTSTQCGACGPCPF